jgi:deoxyribonuclease V
MQQKKYIQHSWNLPPQKTMGLQKEFSERVILSSGPALSKIQTVAGIDTHYDTVWAVAAVVNMDLPRLETVEITTAKKKVGFPYIPGLLSFREGPAILSALQKLKASPDLLIFDGQGIAHPRRFGMACHIGLWVDIPSIGCAKTKLTGQHSEPDTAKGSFSYLIDQGETIGAAVRTRDRVKPVYVSVGHRINLEDSIHVILQSCDKYRLPEPIRRADQLARFTAS